MTEVIQADWDAVDRWYDNTSAELASEHLAELRQVLAAHHQQTVDEIVAWLRGPAHEYTTLTNIREMASHIADAIASGQPFGETSNGG